MRDNEKTLSNYLKKYREDNGLTISEFSRRTGISRPYLSQIETGKIPTRNIIEKLSKGMADKYLVKAAHEVEMLDLAGYKVTSDSELSENENYSEAVDHAKEIHIYESDIFRLERIIESLKTNIYLNDLGNLNKKVFLDGEEIEDDEKKALMLLLLGIRSTRKKKKKNE